MSLIQRLRKASLGNNTETSNAIGGAVEKESLETTLSAGRVDNDLNEVLEAHNSAFDDGDIVQSSSHSLLEADDASSADAGIRSVYAVCETIDDSMFGLHSLPDEDEALKKFPDNYTTEYDWILDGDDDANEDILTPRARRRKLFGDAALDNPLGMMELEDPSLVTVSCTSAVCNDELDEGEGVIEFADFSNFDPGVIQNDNPRDAGVQERNDDWEDFVSAEICIPNYETAHFDEEIDDISQECSEDRYAFGSLDMEKHCEQNSKNDASEEYHPPEEIQQLVVNLHAQLDLTIDSCLATSIEAPAAMEDTCFNDNCESLGSKSARHLRDDSSFGDGKSANSQKIDDLELQKLIQRGQNHRPSLLMAPVLMETLPLPIPDMDSDFMASFAFRVQKHHRNAVCLDENNTDEYEMSLWDDAILERKLVDTIHSSYFDCACEDDEFFDSIVLDEILNVPWPFHEIDLNEPIFEDETTEQGLEENVETNNLNFDSYIFNRLSQLDLAKCEVTKSIMSRVVLKETDIYAGTRRILAAELDVTTALMYANSAREYLQRMLTGYAITDGETVQTFDHHNPVMGSLDVLKIAETKDRMKYLAETIDRISEICDQEAQFWQEITNKKHHESIPIHADEYHRLIEGARKLKNLTLEEEVLNHVASLNSLRERIEGISSLLLDSIEDSLADLIQRMLNANDVCSGEYSKEYETLLHAWASCCQLKMESDGNTRFQTTAIAEEWCGRLLKVFCFEISKAYVFSFMDSLESKTASEHTLREAMSEQGRIKCSSSRDTEMEKLLNSVLADHLVMPSAFYHLSLRSTELLCLYCLLSEWHSDLLVRLRGRNTDGPVHLGMHQHDRDDTFSYSQHSRMSSISSDGLSSTVSLAPDDAADEDSSDEESQGCVPHTFEFKGGARKPTHAFHEHTLKIMNQSIRRPLFTFCESKLAQMIEAYTSRPSVKLTLEDLRVMDDVFHQFNRFSLRFLGDNEDHESDVCKSMRDELTQLYVSHLQSVHIEAMKTTGTLLRHDSWQLSPLNLPMVHWEDDEKKSEGSGGLCDEQSAIIVSLFTAVQELLLGFVKNNTKSGSFEITERAVQRGYRHCNHLMVYLNEEARPIRDSQMGAVVNLHECVKMREFVFFVMQFVDKQPRGEFLVSIMTQSSVNGLLKWTARLLSIGMTLPCIAGDTSAAIMTLFDLYILTIFRFCARSGMNEDALMGIDQSASENFKRKNPSRFNPSMLSLTIEADICAPLPHEDISLLQEYVTQARKRLEGIVNLDKFEAVDAADPPPGSKNDLGYVTTRLQKEVSAVVSSLFASVLVDITSQLLSNSLASEANTSLNGNGSFESFAINIISMTPQFIKLSCRLACVHSLAGKDFLFQILCLGKLWEDHDVKEHSNSYADELNERCAELWALMSTSPSSLTESALKYTWDQMAWAAFYILLEGFSKVPNCSTEGRSLMSMDLATLSHGLNPEIVKENLSEMYPTIKPPPASCREEVKAYVDAYIKVFYYPDEVLHQWITENVKKYREEHMLSLVNAKSASDKESAHFWAASEESIKVLYRN
ncbi:hypothetical protein HJC23_007329 [Cyclotella cryptica]|uniref:Syndetin C-terminal domain-containing protein n=1 Tax=Cyclotella cryptica TaxID=29204 RepID=A0ABD3PCC8_9STRA